MVAATSAKTQSFALVVVNYGSSALLELNLARITVAPEHGFIVVVDNYTTMEERTRVARLATDKNWHFLSLDRNEGFGRGVNAGADVALGLGAECIVTLNPDASISTSDLQSLVALVQDDPGLMVAPTIRTSEGDLWFDGMWLYQESGRVASSRRPNPPRGPAVPWITGACFAISREMWIAVDGFDDDFFLYWEDVDLSRRVVAHGGRLAVESSLSAIHDEGGTQGRRIESREKSEIYYFYNIRNRMLFAAKHLNRRGFWGWMLCTPRVSYEILLEGGRRQLLESSAPWRAFALGILHGAVVATKARFK